MYHEKIICDGAMCLLSNNGTLFMMCNEDSSLRSGKNGAERVCVCIYIQKSLCNKSMFHVVNVAVKH
jgi:hypothetical protein